MNTLLSLHSRNKISMPPGPREHFPFASLLKLHRDPLGFMTYLSHQYGDVVHFRGGALHAYLVTQPDLIKKVLTTHHRDLPIGIWQRQARRLLGNGLITSEGDHHPRQRRM